VNLAGNLIRSHVTILGVRTYLMTLKIRPCVTYLSSSHHCHKHSTEFREKHSSFSTHNWYTVYHMTAWVSLYCIETGILHCIPSCLFVQVCRNVHALSCITNILKRNDLICMYMSMIEPFASFITFREWLS